MNVAPVADLLDRGPEQHRRVRGGQPVHRREGNLDLPRPPFVVDRPRRQAERPQRVADRVEHRGHRVEPGLGQELVAALEDRHGRRRGSEPRVFRCQRAAVGGEDRELDLEPGREVVAEVAEAGELPPQQPPPVERHRLPGGEVRVAQQPAGAVRPGQDPERGRIGHQDDVGEAGELRDAEPAAGRERRHEYVVPGVERVDGAGEVEPVAERADGRLGGQRPGPQDAVLVRHRQPDRPQVVGEDLLPDLAREHVRRVGKQSVPRDKPRLSDTHVRTSTHTGSLGNSRRFR
jgi:hypothetical protein